MGIEVASTFGMDMDTEIPNVPLAKGEDDSEKESSPEPERDTDNNATLKRKDTTKRTPLEVKKNTDFEDSGSLSCSLQSLVDTFDEKVSKCLKDMDQNTHQMAPVPIRTQEEAMSESQMWWTLTGNYGNMMPLDFTKTRIRADQLGALGLQNKDSESSDCSYDANEEEDLRQQLDFHQLVSHNLSLSNELPPLSADQVIEEIDEMIQSCDLLASMTTDRTMESVDSMYSSMKSPFLNSSTQSSTDMDHKMRQASAIASTTENLESLGCNKLATLASEMEQLIRVYNESLVEQLAHRDELEFEKEIKNVFLSLVLSLNNRRRHFHNERKRKGLRIDVSSMPQFATATIPFDETKSTLDTRTMEVLIKIMKAIDDDSPNVPSMLTDYILTIICPSTTSPIDGNAMSASTISTSTILNGKY
uniref:FEZ-like protein n=1 Tax=Rhabditophanes sp. KR3021 TaxID=114890 RepID=A0AC35TGD9_9BILA